MWRLTRLSLGHPRACLALLAALSAALCTGILRLHSEAGYRAFLGAHHPVLRQLDETVARFGGGLPFAAVWSCEVSPACDSVFDPASLAMAHDLARALEATPGVRRVDGPATSPLLFPVFLGLPEVRSLAPDGSPAQDLAELAQRARADPLWAGQIVSPDGKAGALLVHLSSSDAEVGARVLAELRARLAPYQDAGFRFDLVGGPVEFVVAGGELARNVARILPLMLGLVAAALVLLFRSPWEAALTLASVGLAVAWTLGLMGWLGWPQNSLTQALAPLVLVIGVCDAMHLLSVAAARARGGAGAGEPARDGAASDGEGSAQGSGAALRERREAALLDAAREVARPCVLTSLTTAAGFASFSVSGLESFVRFGWIAAFGVCSALLLCFTLLPLLASRLPAPRSAASRADQLWARALAAVVGLAQRRARAVLGLTLVLSALGAWGFARLRVDASFEDLYGEDSQVVRWVRGASRHLRAPETLEIALTPPPGTPAYDPAALRVVQQVEGLSALEGIGAPLSILTPMRELHELVHHEPLPLGASDGERTRHMLRLLRFEDADLVHLFLDEAGGYRVSFQSEKLPQHALRALLTELHARLDALLPPGWSVVVTGPVAVIGTMIDEIRATQLRSFALAGGLVLAIVALAFRSLEVAALALVPALLPVLITLGAMGLAGIPLDVGTAMVAAVLLGLAVDDAIHLLTAYRRRRAAGEPAADAIAAAMGDVGRAVVTSSLALAVGFLVLALAPWKSLASFGFVAAVAVLVALAAAILVLPALLTLLSRRPRFAGPTGSA